jgi:adenylate cyclase
VAAEPEQAAHVAIEQQLERRVVARAAGGEVLCTEPVVDAAGPHLRFEAIGEVRLKGFTEATKLFLARVAPPGGRRSR